VKVQGYITDLAPGSIDNNWAVISNEHAMKVKDSDYATMRRAFDNALLVVVEIAEGLEPDTLLGIEPMLEPNQQPPSTIVSSIDGLPHIWCLCCDMSDPVTLEPEREHMVSEASETMLLDDDWEFVNGRWLCWCCARSARGTL